MDRKNRGAGQRFAVLIGETSGKAGCRDLRKGGDSGEDGNQGCQTFLEKR